MRARVFVGLSVAGFEGDCAPVTHQDQGKRGLPPKAEAPLPVARTAPQKTVGAMQCPREVQHRISGSRIGSNPRRARRMGASAATRLHDRLGWIRGWDRC